MANIYCTTSQLFDMFDMRSMSQLSSDTDSVSALTTRIQNLLDIQAGVLESYLSGRVALPLTPPVSGVLTKWVGVTTAGRMYARRADKPKEIEADEEWAKQWL